MEDDGDHLIKAKEVAGHLVLLDPINNAAILAALGRLGNEHSLAGRYTHVVLEVKSWNKVLESLERSLGRSKHDSYI